MKSHWICLQLRLEAPQDVGNAITSGGLKWQYIAIIVTISSFKKLFWYKDKFIKLINCTKINSNDASEHTTTLHLFQKHCDIQTHKSLLLLNYLFINTTKLAK